MNTTVEELGASPAQLRGENSKQLVFGDDRVKRGAIGSINHVALLRCPPIQRAETAKRRKKKVFAGGKKGFSDLNNTPSTHFTFDFVSLESGLTLL